MLGCYTDRLSVRPLERFTLHASAKGPSRFPHLPEVQREIIGQHSPMTAKMKSKPHRKNSRPDWDEVRFKVMRWCLRVKLAHHYEDFGRLLLATRERPIVEFSRKDDYWGARAVGVGDEDLVGQNVLGRLLMELRQQLKSDAEGALKTVPPLRLSDFLLFGKPIETVVNCRLAHDLGDPQAKLL